MNFQICHTGKTLLFLGTLVSSLALAQTPPDTLMQINGNAASDSSYPPCVYGSPCDYWNLLNGTGNTSSTGGVGNASFPGHSLVRAFINGTINTDSFTGGGSKDPLDVSKWKWSGSPTPNKDTFNAGYAAAYTASAGGDFELMFGADRVSPSGDANVGIWFFQNNVGLNANGTFSGVHKNGDIFVISAFTGGGGNAGIEVLKWDSSCTSGVTKPSAGDCADSNLRLLFVQASAQSCAGAFACATTNAAATLTTWEGSLASPLFFQGGVNLSALLGGDNLPCFSSFLEETRSSQSTSAVLKDFLLGGFPVCSLAITKACDTANPPVLVNNGTQVQYSWTGVVHNTGVGSLSNVEVDDTLPDNSVVHPTLKINGSPVTTLAANDTASYAVTFTVAALQATNTATAKGFSGTAEVDSTGAPASATCSISPSSSVGITKHCVAPGPGLSCSGSGCVVQVPISAHVCNLGSVRLLNVGVSDNPAATISPNSIPFLDPAGTVVNNVPTDCADITGSYQPTSASGDGATNGRFTFSDVISVTSATPALGPALTPIGGMCPAGALACSPVSCPLCSVGECTATSLP